MSGSTSWNERTIRSLVVRYLKRHQPRRYKLTAKTVIRGGDHWYVLGQPEKPGIRAFDYNGNLADTEEEIRDHTKKPPNLLLVPMLPPEAPER